MNETSLRQRPAAAVVALWALALPLFSQLVAHLAFVPAYRTNDDVGMMLIAAGVGLATEPSSQLMFTHHALGAVLAALYESAPTVPWYRLAALVAHVSAGAAVAWAVLRRRCSPLRLALLAVWFASFDLLAAVLPHFTITAFWAAIAGALLLREALERPAGRLVATALVLWAVAGVVRYHSAALVWLLAAPTFVSIAIMRRRDSATPGPAALLRPLAPFVAAGVLIAGLLAWDTWRYAADERWADFNDTANTIGALVDFGRGRVSPADLPPALRSDRRYAGRRWSPAAYAAAERAAGWSPNDYDLLMEWFYADREVYSEPRLRAVLAALPRAPASRLRALDELRADPHRWWLAAVTCLPFTLLPFGRRRRPSAALEAVVSVGALLLLGGAIVFALARFPSWVWQPMLAWLAIHATWRADERSPVGGAGQRARFVAAALALGAVVGLAPASLGLLRDGSRTALATSAGFRAAIERLDPQPDQLYVTWSDGFLWEGILPADHVGPLRGMQIYSAGADTRAPFNADQLERLGVEDIYRAIVDDPRVLVIADDWRNSLLTTFIAEHRGIESRARRLGEYRVGSRSVFSVYRFERVEPRVDTVPVE